MKEAAPGLNLNSVLIMVLLGLTTWTLKTVVEMGTTLATTVEKVATSERDILDLRSRMTAEERDAMRTRYSPARPGS